jgi:hypothetical protein
MADTLFPALSNPKIRERVQIRWRVVLEGAGREGYFDDAEIEG